MNACVGANGGPYNYRHYACGYFQTANAIARDFIERQGLTGVPIDVGIYPLLYLYRQGIELMLKHYIYDRREKPQIDKEHDLKKLWKRSSAEMRSILGIIFDKNDLNKALEKIEDFVMKMHELDPIGQVSRFPENPLGHPFLQEYSVINIAPIYTAGQEVENIFDAFIDGLDELSEYLSDTIPEAEK